MEIAVLCATGHDNGPIQDKHMHEILILVLNSPGSTPFLAEWISCRLFKTRDCVVAPKTLLLIHCLLSGGNRCFEQELRGAHVSKHLQMSYHWFQRSSNPSLCFLHKYATYLEERIRWVINQARKLEPVKSGGLESGSFGEKSVLDLVFRKLPIFQAFIDRVLDCSSFDIFPSDKLVLAAVSNTLKESFQVYLKFSEAIETSQLVMPTRAFAREILKRASQQSKGFTTMRTANKLLRIRIWITLLYRLSRWIILWHWSSARAPCCPAPLLSVTLLPTLDCEAESAGLKGLVTEKESERE